MANNSVVTQEVLQNTLERYHEDFVYPYQNGATHTGFTPVGTVISYFGETAPEYFLICDGTEYAKSDYPQLADLLLNLTDPTPYEGSDANHFKVPDLRGEFLRGTGTNSHTNQGNGANVGEHQDATAVAKLANSGDTLLIPTNNVSGSYVQLVSNSDGDITDVTKRVKAGNATDTVSTMKMSSNVRPTNTSVLYCIAYQDLYLTPRHQYSTDEQIVGTWIDGRPIYEKTIVLSTSFTFVKTTSWTKFIDFPDIQLVIDVKCYDNGNSLKLPPALFYAHSDKIDYFCSFNDMASWFVVNTVTIRYTKTTDTPTV